MLITPNMNLVAWNASKDPYNHTQLATNWGQVDLHDHSPGKGVQIDGSTGIMPASITGTELAPQTITLGEISAGIARPNVVSPSANTTALDGELVIANTTGISITTPATPFLGSVFCVMIPHGNTATVLANGSATMWLPAGTAAVTTTGSLSGFLLVRFICYDGSNWAVYGTSGTTAL